MTIGKRIALGVIAAIAFIAITFFALYLYWKAHSPLLASRNASDQVRILEQIAGRYEAALKADVIGGKNPEETLTLFLDALDKKDIELAVKYFALESNEASTDYLTRNKWRLGLIDALENEQLAEIARTIRAMEPSTRNLGTADAVEYVLYKDDLVERSLILVRNKITGVWKIESL